MSIDRGMEKEDAVHVTMEYYSGTKKEQNDAICGITDVK